MISFLWSVGMLLWVKVLWIILTSSFCGMFVYMFLMSNEHILVLPCMFVCFRLCMSVSELCTLNALGSCMVCLSSFFYTAMSSVFHPTPNLENQVSVFMVPRDKLAKTYHQAPGSFFFAFYYPLGYCWGILIRLHMTETVPSEGWRILFAITN
jgi:hypothetical protein